jgi:hypothetical protein
MTGWPYGSVEGGRNSCSIWEGTPLGKLKKKMEGGTYFKEARIDSRLSNSVIIIIVCY